MAVPHRGADMAQGFIGRLGSALISLPSEAFDVATSLGSGYRTSTGIDSLAPDSLISTELIKFPLPDDIPLHSIIGNNEVADTPGGTDGVVTYESAHIEGVVSEKIIKAGHNVQQEPQGIIEVRRILRLHLQEFDAK